MRTREGRKGQMGLETTCDIETGLRQTQIPQLPGNKGENGPQEGDLETV
jgi:hypothetical protein